MADSYEQRLARIKEVNARLPALEDIPPLETLEEQKKGGKKWIPDEANQAFLCGYYALLGYLSPRIMTKFARRSAPVWTAGMLAAWGLKHYGRDVDADAVAFASLSAAGLTNIFIIRQHFNILTTLMVVLCPIFAYDRGKQLYTAWLDASGEHDEDFDIDEEDDE